MKVRCHTNLDLPHTEKWPDDLPAVPRVGDRICSGYIWHTNGDRIGFQLELEVCGVRWVPNQAGYEETGAMTRFIKQEWIPEIELHIISARKWSITDFYKWYAPLVGMTVGNFI